MATLEWSNLTFTVPGKSSRVVLSEISGCFQPHELTCIIGASGAGKTSLLNILSGRIKSTQKTPFTGSIRLDGEDIAPHKEREQFAYVMQEDALFPTQTPRESILLAATLRKVPEPEKATDKVIAALGLEKCADSLCGSRLIRGISGGEKRRTSIAVEIVSQPKLLFLDEPTSGLDSYSAYTCVKTLKSLSERGQTIGMTLHQPSSEIFHLCDKVIFLVDTHILYSGPVNRLAEHFAACGYVNPPNYNVCDYVVFLMQTETSAQLDALREKLVARTEAKTETLEISTHTNIERKATMEIYAKMRKSSLCTQIRLLFRREYSDVYRDKGTLIARIGIVIFLNLLYGVIFFQTGDVTATDDGGYTANSHFGALTMVAIGCMFGSAQPELLKFPMARPVFIREYASGLYGTTAYVFSKTMVDMPLMFCQSTLVFLITYWLMGLHGNFGYMILSAWTIALSGASVALVIGSLVAQITKAMELAPLVLVPQILFAGFFIRTEQIPTPLDLAQYLCFLKYGLNLFLIVEFGNTDLYERLDAQELLSRNSVDPDLWYVYVLVLAGIFVGFRILAAIALSFKGKGAVY